MEEVMKFVKYSKENQQKYNIDFLEKQLITAEKELSYFVKELGIEEFRRIINKYKEVG